MISKFLDNISKGKLTGAKCNKCGRVYVPPKARCPPCGANTVEVELPKRGYVETYSEVHVSNRETPYLVAIVNLGGVRIPGLVKNAKYDSIRIGDVVEVVFEDNWYFFVLKSGAERD